MAKRHGMTGTRTWRSWNSMTARCLNPNAPKYANYGGRGILICGRWTEPDGNGFMNFFSDMGERPEGRTLDRIDNDGNYEPGNCRWATAKEQRANRRPPKYSPEGLAAMGHGRPRVTHCKYGHPFDELNTRVGSDGTRHCRECGRRRNREHEAKARQARERAKASEAEEIAGVVAACEEAAEFYEGSPVVSSTEHRRRRDQAARLRKAARMLRGGIHA